MTPEPRRQYRPARVLRFAAALAFVSGCQEAKPPAGARFDAVRASDDAGAAQKWCDAWFPESSGPRLVLPRVEPARAGLGAPSAPPNRWVWINVWATWCAPCRREMPLLERWVERLRHEGKPVDIWFLSVDERPADLARVLAADPSLAPGVSLRLSSPNELEGWLRNYQKDPATTIPLQVLVGPGGRVRCIRSGSLADGDFPDVAAVLR